jgi:2-desacetyl-2-hydroxyethyl bacteriochlorophyllide A dehydrogenase
MSEDPPMRAFTITAPNAGEVRDVPAPQPGPGEVLVKPAFVGICGTDYHIYRGSFLSSYPLINGHELSGVIAAVGPAAGDWHEGDRVTVDPTLTCGQCYRCLRGQANHCEHWGAIGDTTDGGLAEYVKIPARNLYRVEDHETLEDAAFTEPLACVVYGIQRLRIQPGDTALVFGAGPIGSLMAQMLALNGVGDLVVVDTSEEKLAVAGAMGARATAVTGPDLPRRLDDRTSGRGFDLVIDCTGVGDVVQGTFRYAGPNSRILFFGVATPETEIRINPFEVYHRDWEILGSMAINGTFGRARDLIASGRVSVRPLLTRVAGLDDVGQILSTAKGPTELKVMVTPNGS